MLLDEHRDQILNRFENTSRSFRRVLTGLIGFAGVFLLIILVPYVSIQHARYRLPQERAALSHEIDRSEWMVVKIRSVDTGMQTLHNAIDASPDRIRDLIERLSTAPQDIRNSEQQSRSVEMLSPIQQVPAGVQQQPEGRNPCASIVDRAEWINCRVHLAVLQQFAEYEKILRQEVIQSLKALQDSGAQIPLDPVVLESNVKDLHASFEMKLQENPRFWHTYQDKVGFSVELTEEVNRFWAQYGKTLTAESEKLRQKLQDLEMARKQLETRLVELEEEEKAIETRLAQIESPLGILPVGLTESILIFPLILAVGFFMAASLFAETVKLRKAFHMSYHPGDSGTDHLSDAQVALIAPLWIDPVQMDQKKGLRYAVLLIPFVVFLISYGLIVYLGLLSESALGSRSLIRWVYLPLYLLSFIPFGYGFRNIQGSIRVYSSDTRSRSDSGKNEAV